ncbi:hypothetical protein [Saccharopolyspora pogona]|uniref:hypothetical protein n=1 Tax=Saccharopolyspora pogona TaxID=333966 RepID=UPI001683545E|nr:hypothetical protein [Saccharopolyspora pogona]
MTDLQVTPEALTGHADGCDSLADKFGQLADVLHQARVDDQCFGPIGQVIGMLNGYYDGLEECQNLAKKAQAFLKPRVGDRRPGADAVHG